MKIGITGADGLIGWHCRAYLKALNAGHDVRLANRATFASADRLAAFVDGLDAIAHFAGMNRGDEREVEAVNVTLARDLTAACEQVRAMPFIAYANSTHQERDTPYGRGKREAALVFDRWAKKSGAGFANLILPHVFGESGRPFYNSVVSTFCHQIARAEPPPFQSDGDLELLHAQEVAAHCVAAISSCRSGDIRLTGVPMKVSELLQRLNTMSGQYRGLVMPPLSSVIDVRLFNTLRSYLYPAHYPVRLQLHTDPRGSLFEAVKSHGGGQTFISTTKPGITRGNHYHTRKVERFLVMAGEAEIRLRKLFTNEVVSFKVRGDAPCYIDMPTFHTHNITNTGTSELVTLFWANEIFDPADSDTFPEPVDMP